MTKIVILLLVAMAAACQDQRTPAARSAPPIPNVAYYQGFPTDPNEDIASLAARGDWDSVHKLINARFGQKDIWAPSSASAGGVRSLKPVNGGEVYGEAEYTFRSTSNVNGQQSESSGGHKIINDNGRIQEFDFKPKY